MSASGPLVLSSALLLAGVHLTGQQQPTPRAGSGAPSSIAAPRAAGNREHGRYLVERVAMCFECHSTRDQKGNLIPGTLFKGGPMPVRPPWPNDWAVTVPRIAGLPGYTEELAIRLLTQGAIKRDGTQARPPMPRFRMTPQDAADVVAYVASL